MPYLGPERPEAGVNRDGLRWEAEEFPVDPRQRFSNVIRVVKSAPLRDTLGLLPPPGEYAEPDELM